MEQSKVYINKGEGGRICFLKKKKKTEAETQNTMQQAGFSEADLALTDEEFFLVEEIDGYSYCKGMNEARCSSECFKAVMMPTVTVMS